MDELNQTQNSNTPPVVPNQAPPVYQVPPVLKQAPKKKNYLFLIVVLVLVAVGAFAWWYVSQMGNEPLVLDEPQINQDAREDALISRELGDVDMGDLDSEFESIDSDINSL